MTKENGLDHLLNSYIEKLNRIDLSIDVHLHKISKLKNSVQFKLMDTEFDRVMKLDKEKKIILEKIDILNRLREIKKI